MKQSHFYDSGHNWPPSFSTSYLGSKNLLAFLYLEWYFIVFERRGLQRGTLRKWRNGEMADKLILLPRTSAWWHTKSRGGIESLKTIQGAKDI